MSNIYTGRLVLSVVLLVLAIGPLAVTSADPQPVGLSAHVTETATQFAGTATVGPLFRSAAGTEHFCTASVVRSRRGNVLLTAAHCVEGTAAGYVFAPGYHDGIAPDGRWVVTAAYLDPAWLTREDPERDFAFLTVAPQLIHGHLEEIQQVTGANELHVGAVDDPEVTIPAYPAGTDNDPVTCTVPLYHDGSYPAFNCNPYVGGTSGAPWLMHTRHGLQIVGLIGGLNQGGCSSFTSYSPPLGRAALRTYDEAATAAPSDAAPVPGGDGC